jgi:hypothetical protein
MAHRHALVRLFASTLPAVELYGADDELSGDAYRGSGN